MSAFFETDRFKRLKNLIIGLGASVVLVGALFKILHWEGADFMLMVGMFTEAFIFLLLGVLPPHKDYYWEKIYPDLDIAPEVEEAKSGKKVHKMEPRESVTKQLDKMLEESKVEPMMIERLGDNLKRLGENIEKLGDVQDAALNTNEYSTKIKDASIAVAEMRDAYSNAAKAMEQITSTSVDTTKYHEQVQMVTKNLGQLNAIYELELQDTNNHLKAMNKFYGSLNSAMDNLQESVTDTAKYREEIGQLSTNLAALNRVYGNMLSAMSTGATR
ncbi:MAG: gliding motility protein GldL [Chitinophagales bacterium]|nr:gliding motility protein GldL [Chitinophagales bacterium]MBP9796360.1 gliding motility protein GldL [Chitinophagales bacterium]